MHSHEEPNKSGRPEFRVTAGRVAGAAFVGIALFFLIVEHRAHLYGALPYLLVLACPLMHLFHRHRHGGHHGEADGDTQKKGDRR